MQKRKKCFTTTERVNTFATLRYQLDHCGVSIEEGKYHNLTWFGVVSYRRLKLEKEEFEEIDFKHNTCPLGQEPLKLLTCLDPETYRRHAKEFWIKEFEEPFLAKDGNPLWIIKEKSAWRG